MDSLMNLTLMEYMEKAKTKEAKPGGGSVAAYVGGVGSALAIMALNLSYGRKEYEDLDDSKKDKLEEEKKNFTETIAEMVKYVDEDSQSFNQALAAFKLPKNTEEEKKIRSEKIQEGYKYALNVPLSTAKRGDEVLQNLEHFAKDCSPIAISDVGCAILFVSASIEAALQNVLINLKSIKDEDFVKETREEVDEIVERTHKNRDEFMKIIYKRIEEEA